MSRLTREHQPIRMLIADAHEVFRRGLRQILEDEDDVQVVAEAADGEEAVRLATTLGTAELDLLLLDLALPKLNGIEATRRIRAREPGLRVIILAVSADDQDLLQATASGAAGLLTKDLSARAIVRSVHDYVVSGALPMSRVTAARVFSLLQERHAQTLAPATT